MSQAQINVVVNYLQYNENKPIPDKNALVSWVGGFGTVPPHLRGK